MAKKKKKSAPVQHRPQPRELSPKLMRQLGEIDTLIDDNDLDEALQRLQAMQRANPRQPDILSALVNLALDMDDMHQYLYYARMLSMLVPGDEDALLATAGGYLNNLFPALAIQSFQTFLRRFPNHEKAAEVQQTIEDLQQTLANAITVNMHLPESEMMALSVEQDTLRFHMSYSQWSEGRSVAQKILQRYPDFAPALNNLSQIEFLQGHYDRAIAATQRVLATAPQNIHALGNLARYLFVQGKYEEAEEIAEQLKVAPVTEAEHFLKQLEAFSFLGNDQAAEDVFQSAQESKFADYLDSLPMFLHLTAASVMRLGDEKSARLRWKKALRADPNFGLAVANLDDLEKPVYERNAPWAYDLAYWLSQSQLRKLVDSMTSKTGNSKSFSAMQRAEKVLAPFPELVALLPTLLERSDGEGRRFVLNLARALPAPKVIEIIRDYASSQWGPDSLRVEAAQIAREQGALAAGELRQWIRGAWTDVRPIAFKVMEEPSNNYQHSNEVMDLMVRSTELLREGKATEAEKLLQQALVLEPGKPDLLNNLATTQIKQGREQEAEELLKRIYAEHPDYFFGIVNMANTYTRRKQFEKAEELLAPLFGLGRDEYHISELKALCMANVNLFYESKRLDAAKSWLEMWEGFDGENPEIDRWRNRLEPQNVINRMSKLLGFGKNK